MRVTDQGGEKVIELEKEEVKKLCRPGAGADTCVWLVFGEVFECLFFSRDVPSMGTTLEEQWLKGRTIAQRDGCDEIRKKFGVYNAPGNSPF